MAIQIETRPNNTKDALKEYCAVNPLDYIMLP